jgi:tetratricopeptide (TPR) repeat protein
MVVACASMGAPSVSAQEASASAGDLFRQANDYFKVRDYDKAAETYEECLGLDPELKEAWYNLGVVYGKLRKYKREIRG